jgi:HEAT repeat protein
MFSKLWLSIFLLGLSGCGPRSPEPYFEQLRDRRGEVRIKAANALLRYGEEVVPRLIEESNSGYIRVRFEVSRLLGRIGDPRAVPALIVRLGDKSANVAKAAAWSLGNIGSPDALEALLRFTGDASKGIRQQVIRSLGFCYTDSVEAALSDSIYKAVVAALEDVAPEVRVSGLEAARQFGYSGLTEKAIHMSRDDSPEVRHVAVQALGQIAVGDAPRIQGKASERLRGHIIEALIVALHESHQAIRTKAVRALGLIGGQKAVLNLERLHTSGSVEDKREAGLALEKIQRLAAGP